MEFSRSTGIAAHQSPVGQERPEVSLRQVTDVLSLLETAASDLLSLPPSGQRARSLAHLAGVSLKAVGSLKLEEREAANERQFQALIGSIW